MLKKQLLVQYFYFASQHESSGKIHLRLIFVVLPPLLCGTIFLYLSLWVSSARNMSSPLYLIPWLYLPTSPLKNNVEICASCLHSPRKRADIYIALKYLMFYFSKLLLKFTFLFEHSFLQGFVCHFVCSLFFCQFT